jgi:hypothetical protein
VLRRRAHIEALFSTAKRRPAYPGWFPADDGTVGYCQKFYEKRRRDGTTEFTEKFSVVSKL